MPKIKVLPQNIADKIAAGEVAERPQAVVKELVENSIDAGADKIEVEIKNGGIKYIRVTDNGCGIPKDQVETAFLRHATSKLRKIEDLYSIGTMGFRGEALASICAVASVRVITRAKGEAEGTIMELIHGVPQGKDDIACNCGTIMEVSGLFENVPARMKFLKKDSTEAGYVADIMGRIAMANPDTAFKYICDGKEIFSTSGDKSLKNAILNIYGLDYAKGLIEVDYERDGVHIFGVCGKSDLARGNRTRQSLFVNGRYVKNHVIAKVCEEAYRNYMMSGKFPFFALNINLAPELVDVNVHPAKTEIKFADEKRIYEIIHSAVRNALMNSISSGQTVKAEAYPKTKGRLLPDELPAGGGVCTDAEDSGSAPEESAKSETVQMKMRMPVFMPKRENIDRKTVEKFIEYTAPKGGETVFRENREENHGESYEKNPYEFIEETSEEIPFKIIGQLFDTYVIFESGDKMFIIDQHAAHERFRFEKLMADYKAKKPFGQILMIPVVMDLSQGEMAVFRENKNEFSSFGFEIEEFGTNGVIIRQTPIDGGENEIKALVGEMLDTFAEGAKKAVWDYEEKMIDMISCKYAIKANKKLSTEEMADIIRKTQELEKCGKATCPHGRPIKIELGKQEIEKMFKRIV